MSHTRDQRIELRAIFAVAAVCALVFSLLVSGAPHGSRAEASMQASSGGDVHQAMCHLSSVDASKDGTPDNDGRTKRAGCPCCLAAHAGPAVLPERSAASMRLERTATRALYMAPSDASPRCAVSHAVNGARAPPRLHAIS